MFDANGSRFALLLGPGDWGRCRLDAAGAPLLATLWRAAQAGEDISVPLVWEAENAALALAERVRPFRAGRGDLAPAAHARRGAATDAHGNLYAVVDGGRRIEVWSVGDDRASSYWPLPAGADSAATGAGKAASPTPGSFVPVTPATPPRPRRWRGLAVTSEQYLVVGIEAEPGGAPGSHAPALPGGLLVFDLAAGGPPLELAWPQSWPFAPLALAARPCGGLVVLDREHGRVWCLSRQLGMQTVAPSEGGSSGTGGFVSQGPAPPAAAPAAPPQPPWFALHIDASGGDDPIAVQVLPDGSVLVLDARGRDGFARLARYVGGMPAGQDSTAIAATLIDAADRDRFTLVGFDFALADSFGSRVVSVGEPAAPPRVVVASAEGNQAYAFELRFDLALGVATLVLVPGKQLLPLKRYGGRNLIRRGPARLAGDTGVVYHSSATALDGRAGRWVPLVAQRRPRYEPEAACTTPALDGRELGCVWHRVLVDGCLPPGCELVVESRADDDPSRLPRQPWRREPTLLRRPGGSELPWLRDAPGAAALPTEQGHGSFELLLQAARGQHLQLRLLLRGNELATPRLVALRAWSPRFSYAQHYLPAIYRRNNTVAEGDNGSDSAADFLERFLANFEGQFTAIEDRISAAGALFDVRSAPGPTLDWLAGWLGLVLDPALDDARRRQLIRHAVPLFQYRGTPRALSLALELALSNCLLDDAVFRLPAPSRQGPGGVRLVERFLARRLPVALLGETVIDTQPRTVAVQARWSLAEGASGLHRRWQVALRASGVSAETAATARFAPVPPAASQPGTASLWLDFCGQQLGAVPALAPALQAAWQAVVARGADAGLGPQMPAAWPDDGRAQASPATLGQQKAWRDFINGLPGPLQRWLRRWQAFLARRYLRVVDYRAGTGQAWPGFEWIPAPTLLPDGDQALADWALFETTVEAIAAHAHRFSVLLPTNGPLADPAALAAATDLAQRVVALEKPAHTRFDIKPYWALFRVGQARLGLDSLLGRGSRDPALAPALVLGRGQVGTGRVAPLAYQPPTPGDRVRLEC